MWVNWPVGRTWLPGRTAASQVRRDRRNHFILLPSALGAPGWLLPRWSGRAG